MNGPMNQISNIVGSSIYQTLTSMPEERDGSDLKRDIAKTSWKYIAENNKIVFEQYDRYGRLISRVPWSVNSVREKA